MSTQIIRTWTIRNMLVSVTYRQIGQQEPQDGDDVIAQAILSLPAIREHGVLDPRLIFGSRVNLLGQTLHRRWGEPVADTTTRTLSIAVVAPTYSLAYQQLSKQINEAVATLQHALDSRQQALEMAGEFID